MNSAFYWDNEKMRRRTLRNRVAPTHFKYKVRNIDAKRVSGMGIRGDYKDQRSFYQQNAALCRRFQTEWEGKTAYSSREDGRRSLPQLRFMRVQGVTRFWENRPPQAYLRLFQQLPAAMVSQDSLMAFLLCGDAAGVRIYLGASQGDCGTLMGALQGFLPGVQIEEPLAVSEIQPPCRMGGVMLGNPSEMVWDHTNQPMPLPVDNICRGMAGEAFSFLVIAQRLPNMVASGALRRVMEQMRTLSLYQRIEREGEQQNRFSQEDYEVQDYMGNLQKMGDMLRQAVADGLWETVCYYAANRPVAALRLQGILKGSYNGASEMVCQPIICLNMQNIHKYICPECAFMDDFVLEEMQSPVSVSIPQEKQEFFMNDHQFQTTLSGQQLSLLCRLPQHEYPGYYVDDYVEFDSCWRGGKEDATWVELGQITQAGRSRMGFQDIPYLLELNDFTRHLLVIGITGGGKSNTSKSILRTLWTQHHKPFLVIESAKREYHELMNLDATDAGAFSGLCVFTMGDDNGVPYRINPFEKAPGVGLQTHIDYLLSTFNAAFEMVPPMPYVLESSVYEVYQDRGWDVTSGVNCYGRTDWPTLTDLYYKVEVVTNRLGYHVEVQNNVKAALKARINSLRIGGKGLMLDTPSSLPIGKLLDRPVVLELEDLADDDTKAFVIGVLLVQLYEFRKGQSLERRTDDRAGVPASSKDFQHLLVVEEAHRLLKRVEPGEGNPSRAKSVEFFCNMLAEIRSYGQGLMICDQVPTKLAPDVLKNTNLKVIHRTVMEEDRRAVGAAMNMNDAQMEYLSSLRRGCAAVFAEGDNRPKLVTMPLVIEQSKLDRQQILERVRQNVCCDLAVAYETYTQYDLCRFCQHFHSCREQTRTEMDRVLEQHPVDVFVRKAVEQAQEQNVPLPRVLTLGYLQRLLKTVEVHWGTKLQPQQQFCLAAKLIERLPMERDARYALVVKYQLWWSQVYLR